MVKGPYATPTCPVAVGVLVMLSAAVEMVIVGVMDLTVPELSVRVMVGVYEVAVVGVPESTPPEKVSPAGRTPEYDHVYGDVPPDPFMVKGPYAVPTVPLGGELVIDSEAGLTVSEYMVDTDCCVQLLVAWSWSLTVMVILVAVPDDVGVPEITPVDWFRDKPDGRFPPVHVVPLQLPLEIDHIYVAGVVGMFVGTPPEAFIEKEYAEPV